MKTKINIVLVLLALLSLLSLSALIVSGCREVANSYDPYGDDPNNR